ncbi:somatostatin receptor type 2-like [Condylostylus longicornis]|uniref:somatostatin receptor type 2-like n=1 Tax=Condylostylus longicornis TaxID=2530218 RepID=UPI00244DFE1B|nr:somatostatin receptor type 2-like [Condylostylus longicornis]XP_055378667.1 somatostatin receptor type 2-like [Condylostylus longicornis]
MDTDLETNITQAQIEFICHHANRSLYLYNLNDTSLCLNTNNTLNFINSNNFNFNNNNYSDTGEHVISPVIRNIIYTVLYTCVLIIGLFGNTLVIYVVIRFSKMQTVTNIYILNLAIADELFLIGIPFILTTMHLGSWHFGNTMCKAYLVSTCITQYTSSLILLIMSGDRFAAVCHPITMGKYRTPFYSKIFASIAWLISLFFVTPILLFASANKNENGQYTCNIYWNGYEDGAIYFTTMSIIFAFAIPFSLMIIFYVLVVRKLHTVGPKSKSKEKKRSHRKVTRLVLTVVTVYILSWLPYWMTQISLIYTDPYQKRSKLEVYIFLISSCLGYTNSAVNPILYAFLSDNFKKSFVKAFQCATQGDLNTQLQAESSFFPKFGKNKHHHHHHHHLHHHHQHHNGGSGSSSNTNKKFLNNTKNQKKICNIKITGTTGTNNNSSDIGNNQRNDSTVSILGENQSSVTYHCAGSVYGSNNKNLLCLTTTGTTTTTTTGVSFYNTESQQNDINKNGLNHITNSDDSDNSIVLINDKPAVLQSDL